MRTIVWYRSASSPRLTETASGTRSDSLRQYVSGCTSWRCGRAKEGTSGSVGQAGKDEGDEAAHLLREVEVALGRDKERRDVVELVLLLLDTRFESMSVTLRGRSSSRREAADAPAGSRRS